MSLKFLYQVIIRIRTKTHARGNINKVLANLYKIKIAKDKHQSKTNIFIGYHLYKHNAKKFF